MHITKDMDTNNVEYTAHSGNKLLNESGKDKIGNNTNNKCINNVFSFKLGI